MNETKTILLVDDSENDRMILRAALENAGCANPLLEVRDGEAAIAYLKGEGPFHDRDKFPLPIIMLLDLNMPRKDGFGVLAWVRSQPGLKRLAVVVLTASARNEDMERAFDLGATSFLVKPSTFEALTTMMRRLGGWLQIAQFPRLDAAEKK